MARHPRAHGVELVPLKEMFALRMLLSAIKAVSPVLEDISIFGKPATKKSPLSVLREQVKRPYHQLDQPLL